jgi:hypothetical protein
MKSAFWHTHMPFVHTVASPHATLQLPQWLRSVIKSEHTVSLQQVLSQSDGPHITPLPPLIPPAPWPAPGCIDEVSSPEGGTLVLPFAIPTGSFAPFAQPHKSARHTATTRPMPTCRIQTSAKTPWRILCSRIPPQINRDSGAARHR